MRKYMIVMLCAAISCMAGCGSEAIVESTRHDAMAVTEEVETEMTTEKTTEMTTEMSSEWETEMVTEIATPEPSFAAQLKAAEDLEQLIIVEAHSRDGIEATVTLHEKQDGLWTEILNVDGYLGYGGIDKKKEGDGKTPTGLYGLSVAFGKKEDPGSLIPYTQIDEKYWWVGDYNSKYFNQLCHQDMKGRDWKLDPAESEHLWDYKGYNYCLFIEYNTEGEYKKGSCIFLHCIGQKLETLGCIAVAEEDMIFILQHLREGAKILIDTAENLTSY